MTSGEVYVALFVAVVLGIVVVAVLLLAISRLRKRRAQLLDDLKNAPELIHDRAFNRLAMARREVEILSRQGTDVSRAREMIAQSQSAFDLSKFDRSYELAQSAHEALVAARSGRPLASTAGAPPLASRASPAPVPVVPVAGGGSPASGSASEFSTRSPLIPNQAQSQFELKLLDAELAEANRSRPENPGTLAAVELRTSAQKAWDVGQYTESFRFALRARRSLGSVEAVGLSPGPGGAPSGLSPGSLDASDAAERAASSARCPDCGYPVTADDAFCRGCGVPRTPGPCPSCGAPRGPRDAFCGRCGRTFS
jgi:Double zinc ribbon